MKILFRILEFTKITTMKVMREMIKSLVILGLVVYSTFITIRYFEEKDKRIGYQKKLEEFYRWYEFTDTTRIKYVEVPVLKEIPKKEKVYVYKKERDTVYQVVFQSLRDTLWGSFYNEILHYIYIKDSLGVYQVDDKFALTIRRKWGYLSPLYIRGLWQEKGVDKYTATYFIAPGDLVENVNIHSYYKFRPLRVYVGAGAVLDRQNAYPIFDFSVLSGRWKLGLGIGLDRWVLTTNYRVY